MRFSCFVTCPKRKASELARAHLAAIVELVSRRHRQQDPAGHRPVLEHGGRAVVRLYGAGGDWASPSPSSFHRTARTRKHEILARIARGERIEHFETVRMTKDGRRLDISLTVSPIRDASGEIIGASKIARDITDRKRAEEALKEVESSKGSSSSRCWRTNFEIRWPR